jgi:hypothetical protein
MPQHHRSRLQPSEWERPPPQRGQCQHGHPEWFVAPFNKDSVESQDYFASAADIATATWNYNKLQQMCSSACDVFHIPHHNSQGTTLYVLLQGRPDLYLQWHNPKGGEGITFASAVPTVP